jgi:hypothetical protein
MGVEANLHVVHIVHHVLELPPVSHKRESLRESIKEEREKRRSKKVMDYGSDI